MVEGIGKRKESPADIEIFTPAELRKILHAATPKAATCIALQAFAGVRSEELLRLTWADLERRKGFIEISAGKAKTAQRRSFPSHRISRSGWRTHPPRQSVWPHSKPFLFETMRNAAAKANVTWKANGLRHSFITYRLAATKDVAEVALEAGNSPAMIFRHYRELATEEEAAEWFGILPDEPAPEHRSHEGMKNEVRLSSLFSLKAIEKSKPTGGPEGIQCRRARGDENTATNAQAEEHAREEAARKASLRKDIRTCRQKLQREAGPKGMHSRAQERDQSRSGGPSGT